MKKADIIYWLVCLAVTGLICLVVWVSGGCPDKNPLDMTTRPQQAIAKTKHTKAPKKPHYTHKQIYKVQKKHLTKRKGVNRFHGVKETYYSSRVLKHYKIKKWHLDKRGVWRTKKGYVVVSAARGWKKRGAIVKTSLGIGKVLDCGCARGVFDIYTNW